MSNHEVESERQSWRSEESPATIPSVTGAWRVGEAANPHPNDKTFELLNDALAHARLSAKRNWSLPIAVWDTDDNIDYLFLCGEIFRRT